MPCNSDYLEPSHVEKETRRAAKLYVYLKTRLGQHVEPWVASAARDIYASDKRLIPMLCEALKAMPEKERDAIGFYISSHPIETYRKQLGWFTIDRSRDGVRSLFITSVKGPLSGLLLSPPV